MKLRRCCGYKYSCSSGCNNTHFPTNDFHPPNEERPNNWTSSGWINFPLLCHYPLRCELRYTSSPTLGWRRRRPFPLPFWWAQHRNKSPLFTNLISVTHRNRIPRSLVLYFLPLQSLLPLLLFRLLCPGDDDDGGSNEGLTVLLPVSFCLSPFRLWFTWDINSFRMRPLSLTLCLSAFLFPPFGGGLPRNICRQLFANYNSKAKHPPLGRVFTCLFAT